VKSVVQHHIIRQRCSSTHGRTTEQILKAVDLLELGINADLRCQSDLQMWDRQVWGRSGRLGLDCSGNVVDKTSPRDARASASSIAQQLLEIGRCFQLLKASLVFRKCFLASHPQCLCVCTFSPFGRLGLWRKPQQGRSPEP
jgi:hypothetical protein